jgi:hypothetical protein
MQARQQSIDELSYGNGPRLYGFTSNVSMLQRKIAIDNERAYLEDDLTRACVQQGGFVLVPATTVLEQTCRRQWRPEHAGQQLAALQRQDGRQDAGAHHRVNRIGLRLSHHDGEDDRRE